MRQGINPERTPVLKLTTGCKTISTIIEGKYITDNWNVFTEEHDMKPGHIIVFLATAKAEYTALIFKNTNVERIYPWYHCHYT